jgi:hypothetical protein
VKNQKPILKAESVPAVVSAQILVGAAEAAIVDLETNLPDGMGKLELALAARVRAACGRLLDCVAGLAREELIVAGSTGQRRPHPLLKVEQELRKEIACGLAELTFRAENRSMWIGAKRSTSTTAGESQ